jgi:hypothetical protein
MRCKVGDLAIVIRPLIEANLGILVEVCESWPEEPGFWWVRSLSGPRPRKDGATHLEGAIADAALWPISGGGHGGLRPESRTALVHAVHQS